MTDKERHFILVQARDRRFEAWKEDLRRRGIEVRGTGTRRCMNPWWVRCNEMAQVIMTLMARLARKS